MVLLMEDSSNRDQGLTQEVSANGCYIGFAKVRKELVKGKAVPYDSLPE